MTVNTTLIFYLVDSKQRVVCNAKWMALYFDAGITIYNNTSMSLRNKSCTAKRDAQSNEWVLKTDLTGCGTAVQQTEVYIIYQNEATWIFGGIPGSIVRSYGKIIRFSCSFNRIADGLPAIQINSTNTGYFF